MQLPLRSSAPVQPELLATATVAEAPVSLVQTAWSEVEEVVANAEVVREIQKVIVTDEDCCTRPCCCPPGTEVCGWVLCHAYRGLLYVLAPLGLATGFLVSGLLQETTSSIIFGMLGFGIGVVSWIGALMFTHRFGRRSAVSRVSNATVFGSPTEFADAWEHTVKTKALTLNVTVGEWEHSYDNDTWAWHFVPGRHFSKKVDLEHALVDDSDLIPADQLRQQTFVLLHWTQRLHASVDDYIAERTSELRRQYPDQNCDGERRQRVRVDVGIDFGDHVDHRAVVFIGKPSCLMKRSVITWLSLVMLDGCCVWLRLFSSHQRVKLTVRKRFVRAVPLV